jgi:FkbM family methyltransferase
MKIYVQIGANIGDDDFQRDIECLTDAAKVILIEPNSRLIEQLDANYKKLKEKHEIIICNKAISIKNELTKLYIYYESGHSSLIKRKSHMTPLEEINVESISFNELCKNLNVQEVEKLQIDTEGLDYEIVNSIDFSKVIIKTLVFEDWDHPDDDLNDNYRTGFNFLETEVKHKLESIYNWGGLWLSGMPNHILTLKV